MITKINITHNILGKDGITPPEHLTVRDFEHDTASSFSREFNRVLGLPQSVVPINVDSYGGQVYSLLGMLDVMEASEKPTLTFTTSKAMSCGAVLLSAGKYRFMSKNAVILIHEVGSFSFGKNTDIQADANETARLNDILLNILAKNSKKPKRFYKDLIKEANNADLFITPRDALSYGLIDKIGLPVLEMNVSVNYSISLRNG